MLRENSVTRGARKSIFGLIVLLCGCSGESSGSGGGGGAANLGGSASGGQPAGTGGGTFVSAVGGAGTSGGTTGTANTAIGGAATTGGAVTAGGASPSGGNVATGGNLSTGGAAAAGGSIAIAGAAATGGMVATGGKSSTGTLATGGAVTTTTGGKSSTGGSIATGGAVATAGKSSTGGSVGTGGAIATGGKAATGGATGNSCLTPPAQDPVVGWAAVNGMSVATTTGGGNATPQVVTTLSAFQTAVAGTTPAVIYLNAVLAPASIAVGSNKTIVGVCGAEVHGHLGVSRSTNVIVRNLKIVGYAVGDCTLDPAFDATVGCSSGADAVSITSGAHHIWFDHCDISDGTDGNLDTNAASDFVTISWTKFHYTPRTDNVGSDSTGAGGHRFSNLIGSADNLATDVGHLNMTWHHNWWADNVNQRMPRSRYGQIHVVNNLFTSTGNSYCTNSGIQTHLLVENNVYIGVHNPLSPDANGDMLARNNVYTNTTGTNTATGTGFTPPYTYTPDATSALEAAIRSGAGPH